MRRQKHAELRSLNLVWKDGKVSTVSDSSTEGEGDSDGTGDERRLDDGLSSERAMKRNGYPRMNREDSSTDREDMSRDAESNCLQSVSSVDSISSEDGPCTSPLRDSADSELGYHHAEDAHRVRDHAQTTSFSSLPSDFPRDPMPMLNDQAVFNAQSEVDRLEQGTTENSFSYGFPSFAQDSPILTQPFVANQNLDFNFQSTDLVLRLPNTKKVPALNDLSFSETVFDNETFPLADEIKTKKRRLSKGAPFQLNSVVYVPDLKKVGVITEEKNGGWKYVRFESGTARPPEKNRKDIGKWCRAGEMILEEGTQSGNNCYLGPDKYSVDAMKEAEEMKTHQPEIWTGTCSGFGETPFSMPDDFLEAFETHDYW